MRDLALQLAGVLAIVVSLIHGVVGERVVFANTIIEPPRMRLLIRLVWQAGTVAWIGGGILFIVAAWMFPDPARRATILVFVVIYAAGALGNAWATGGRHIGWMALAVVVALALAGL